MAKVKTLVKFLDYISKHPNASDDEIAEAIGVTERYVRMCREDIAILKPYFLRLVLPREDIRIILSKFTPITDYEKEIYGKLVYEVVPHASGVIRLAKPYDERSPKQLNIALLIPFGSKRGSGYITEFWLKALLYDTLIWVNLRGEEEPRLAESVEPRDGYKRWSVKLRGDISWSNGKSITSDDVISSLGSTGLVREIEEFKKEGERDIEIVLRKQDPLFKWRLRHIPILPSSGLLYKVTGGAYRLKRAFKPTGLFRLKANPDYYRENRPLIEYLTLREFSSITSALKAFRKNEVDFIPLGNLYKLRQISGEWYPQSWPFDNRYYVLVLNKGGKLADPEIYEKLRTAIDYDAVKSLISGEADGKRVEGEYLDLRMGYVTEVEREEILDVAEIVAGSIGSRKIMDASDWPLEERRRNLDLICTEMMFGQLFQELKRYFHSKGENNLFGHAYPEIDDMLEELEKFDDPVKRKELGETILKMLQQDRHIILLGPSFDYFISNMLIEVSEDLTCQEDFIFKLPDLYIDREWKLGEFSSAVL